MANIDDVEPDIKLPSPAPPNLKELFNKDSQLKPYEFQICYRYSLFHKWLQRIETDIEGGLMAYTLSYNSFGLHRDPKTNTMRCKEWVPHVSAVSIVGDFNNWDTNKHHMQSDPFGIWSIEIPPLEDGSSIISHHAKYKLAILTNDGKLLYRLSPWVKYALFTTSENPILEGYYWDPLVSYEFVHTSPPIEQALKIYECHIGISSWEGKVASYKHFTDNVLPYIKATGYNCVELMAIQEHAYYASFGYQVTNFFATSSRYGTPDELKCLIDNAHGMGLIVILDIVHSHCSKNIIDGLNEFNGTDSAFFHTGGRGTHSHWNTRLFNYDQIEVVRFLLSNLRWFIDEFHFDGFRFDGVTSMLYHHHGNYWTFSGNYDEYYGHHTDLEGCVYLMLANYILHSFYPDRIVTIGEDVSGMPTLCIPVEQGGFGFDYRLAMAIPDLWIKLLKEVSDENWNMTHLVFNLENRRDHEKHISYSESHDQSLVGDKTLAFWLMDAEMYTNMSTLSAKTPTIDRGMALHKLIRLITFGLGGEGYLTFIGNEFGHPEWLDFPRAGNNYDYHYARRQMFLKDDGMLRYQFLYNFEQDMLSLDTKYRTLSSGKGFVTLKHNDDKLISFERGGLVFVFNFHPTKSYTGYPIGVNHEGPYRVILSSDSFKYEGTDRIDVSIAYYAKHDSNNWHYGNYTIQLYLPSRTALVLVRHDSLK